MKQKHRQNPATVYLQTLRRLPTLLVIAGLLLCVRPASAVSPKKSLEHLVQKYWTKEDGMPSGYIKSIVQTRDGYLWLAAQDGLSRFNGVDFKTFSSEDDSDIPGHQVNDILEADDGVLWIGMLGGLLTYDGHDFRPFEGASDLSSDQITTLAQDKQGNVWVGTEPTGINILKGDTIEELTDLDGLADNNINDILVTKEGPVWIATGGGISVFHKDALKPPPGADTLPSKEVLELFADPDGSIWVGTAAGLSVFDGSKFTNIATESGMPIVVSAILKDRDNNLWVGEYDGPVWRLENGVLVAQRTAIEVGVKALLEDNEGSLWIGGSGKAMVQARDGNAMTLVPSNHGGPSDIIKSIVEQQDGQIWFATPHGIGTTDGSSMRFFGKSEGLVFSNIVTLAPASDGGLWLGLRGGGVAKFKDGEFSFITTEDGLSDGHIRSIYEAPDKTLYVGTVNGGLNVIRDGVITALSLEEGLPAKRVSVIHDAGDGELLLGTINGVSRYQDGRFSTITLGEGTNVNRINGIHTDKEGRLWCATLDGLVVLVANTIHRIGMQHGLPDRYVYSILDDQFGHYWFGSNHGVYRISKTELHDLIDGKIERLNPTVFGIKDGMKSPECNGGYQNVALRSRDGRLWFATMQGMVVFDPKQITYNDKMPPIYIEDVLVDGEPYQRHTEITSRTEQLEFAFTGLSFIMSERMKFKYRLTGLNDTWIDAHDRRVASYTKLPYGDYRFEVIGSNGDGFWNETGASFSFQVVPLIHETLWFKLLAVLALLAIFGLSIFFIGRKFQQRREALSELAWQQTRKILDSQVDSIRKMTSRVAEIALQTRKSMQTLAAASKQLTASVTEAAATIEQLERSGRSSELNAKEILEAVEVTQEESEKGRDWLARSREVMGAIRLDSQNVDQRTKALMANLATVDSIIGKVRNVTEHSQVLSINASIEAAKAGELGAGFEVVAQNMTELAKQTSTATEEIIALLESVSKSTNDIAQIAERGQNESENGEVTISNSGRVIDSLSHKLNTNATLANTILKGVEQQLIGLRQIAHAMMEMNATAAQNEEISRQVATGTETLNEVITDLSEIVESWDTSEFYEEGSSALILKPKLK